MRPWIQYSLIRIVLFVVVLTVLVLVGVQLIWAAIIAAVVGFCVSYLFFRGKRDAMALSIAERRARGDKNMDEAEDDALDQAE